VADGTLPGIIIEEPISSCASIWFQFLQMGSGRVKCVLGGAITLLKEFIVKSKRLKSSKTCVLSI
jgi:hypothetical protein